jgi:hypothetical protein
MHMIQEAGYAVWGVLALGAMATALGVRFAIRPRKEDLPVVAALVVATLLFGTLGTIIGVQVSAAHIGEVEEGRRFIFLLGVREALHNLVLAVAFGLGTTLCVALGLARRKPPASPAPAPVDAPARG